MDVGDILFVNIDLRVFMVSISLHFLCVLDREDFDMNNIYLDSSMIVYRTSDSLELDGRFV